MSFLKTSGDGPIAPRGPLTKPGMAESSVRPVVVVGALVAAWLCISLAAIVLGGVVFVSIRVPETRAVTEPDPPPAWAHDGPVMRTVCGPLGPVGVPPALADVYAHMGFERGPCGGAGRFFCEGPLTALVCLDGRPRCASRWNVPHYTRVGATPGPCPE